MGDTPVKVNEEEVNGSFVELEGERFYRISSFDRMPDFFMSIVSASDHWMFISSNGSLTAGRKNDETLGTFRGHAHRGLSGEKEPV